MILKPPPSQCQFKQTLGKSSSSKSSSKSSSDSCGTPSKSPGKSSTISGSTKSYTKRLTFVTLAVTVLLAAGASLHFLTLDGQYSLVSISNGAHPKVYPGDHVKEHSEPNEGPRGGKDAKGGRHRSPPPPGGRTKCGYLRTTPHRPLNRQIKIQRSHLQIS